MKYLLCDYFFFFVSPEKFMFLHIRDIFVTTTNTPLISNNNMNNISHNN